MRRRQALPALCRSAAAGPVPRDASAIAACLCGSTVTCATSDPVAWIFPSAETGATSIVFNSAPNGIVASSVRLVFVCASGKISGRITAPSRRITTLPNPPCRASSLYCTITASAVVASDAPG